MSVPFFAKALFDYEAVEASELTVVAGDFLTVEEVNESGWCLARKGDLNGWLPTDYVQKIESEVGAKPEPIQVSKPTHSREIQATESGLNSVPPPHQQQSLDQQTQQNITDTLMGLMQSGTVPSSVSSTPSASSTASSAAKTPSQAPNPNAKICAFCHEAIKSAFVLAKDKPFHPNHFQCKTCSKELGGRAYLEKDESFFCEDCYYAAFNPKCGACHEIIKGPYISALDQSWHAEHFVCSHCHEPFAGNQFRKHENKPYCEKHFEELFAPKCSTCGLGINGQVFEALDQKYHLDCFVCEADKKPIGEGVSFHVHENKVYCPTHFENLFLQKCQGCKEVIKGQFIKVMDQHFHSECWKCSQCSVQLKGDNCALSEDKKFYCKPCLTAIRHQARQPVLQQMGSNPQAAPDQTAKIPPPSDAKYGANAASGMDEVEKANAALEKLRLRQAQEAAQAATPASSTAASSSAYAEPGSKTYEYAILKDKNARPADVDPSRKEQYLSDAEFQTLFKLTKEEFGKLPDWRKKALKTPLLLF